MDEDPGGLEDVGDEEGMAKFLEGVIGDEYDEDFVNEFKSSELFVDFLKELSGNKGSANASRRPSLESDKAKKDNDNTGQGNLLNYSVDTPEESRASDSSSSTDSYKPDQLKSNVEKDTHSLKSRSSLQEKAKSKSPSPVPPSNSKKFRDRLKICLKPSGAIRKEKKGQKNETQENTSHQMGIAIPSNSSFASSKVVPGGSREYKKRTVDARVTSSNQKTNTTKSHRNETFKEQQQLLAAQEVTVALFDLLRMTKTFPDGLSSPVLLTSKLLEEIRRVERDLQPGKKQANRNKETTTSCPPQQRMTREEHAPKQVERNVDSKIPVGVTHNSSNARVGAEKSSKSSRSPAKSKTRDTSPTSISSGNRVTVLSTFDKKVIEDAPVKPVTTTDTHTRSVECEDIPAKSQDVCISDQPAPVLVVESTDRCKPPALEENITATKQSVSPNKSDNKDVEDSPSSKIQSEENLPKAASDESKIIEECKSPIIEKRTGMESCIPGTNLDTNPETATIEQQNAMHSLHIPDETLPEKSTAAALEKRDEPADAHSLHIPDETLPEKSTVAALEKRDEPADANLSNHETEIASEPNIQPSVEVDPPSPEDLDDYVERNSPESNNDEKIAAPNADAADYSCSLKKKSPSPDRVPSKKKSPSPDRVPSKKKSPSPDRVPSKKKHIIDSSSDDGDGKKDDNDASLSPERKKSSDEEPSKGGSKSLPFERKRDKVDPRSRKFDKFEHERQRKLGEIKKGKEKPKERDALEEYAELLKDKQLSSSFRIPKKSTTDRRHESKVVATPLATSDVPKENLQFERFRKNTKGNEKERNWNDFGSPRGDGIKRAPEAYERFGDDTRKVVLASDEINNDADRLEPPPLEQGPTWDDEPEGSFCGGEDTNAKDVCKSNENESKEKAKIQESPNDADNIVEKEVDNTDSPLEFEAENPEVPLTDVVVNPISVGVMTLLEDNKPPCLPDTEKETNLASATVMKLAWWLWKASNYSHDELHTAESPDSYCESPDSNRSFLDKLNLTDTEDDRNSEGGPAIDTSCAVKEFYGRSLLEAKLRLGPGDKLVNIFQIRGSYDKSFQAECTLCHRLIIGQRQLSAHAMSEVHQEKMAALGVESKNSKGSESISERKLPDTNDKDNQRDKRDEKAENDKSSLPLPASKNDKSKQKNEEVDDRSKANKKPSDEDKRDKDRKSEKRKRSKEKSPVIGDKSRASGEAEIGRTSSGLKIKIPAGAIPERKHSDSKERRSRSRSRSPRQKRTRSKSPRHRRSPSRKSRSPRRRRRSRTPVERIPRSPTRIRELRRRSTSTERVQKFLAKTNQRTRSPSNGYSRKRHRRSRSKSPPGPAVPKRDNREFHEKLALTADGKWTDEMEQRWKLMEADEAMFIEQYSEKSKMLKEVPEKHPNYGVEWTMFWEKRYQEVEENGIDPEQHDYVPEWKEFWTKRLNLLLEIEYEEGIKSVKKKHGVDLESLQKLRAIQETVVMPVAESPISNVPTPQPVPPPSAVVITPPLPAAILQLSASLSSKISKTISDIGEDLTARSMSISDSGGEDGKSIKNSNRHTPAPVNVAAVKQPMPPVTTGDIMSTWEKLKSGELVGRATGSSAQSRSSIPIGRSIEEKSEDSGSIASFDFDGFDLVQVLRLMSNLEEQLSFFAPKVQEYFKTAEELELKKQNKSYILLDDEDFVIMLFQVRDRFMAMIRANILSKDVLRSLNLTVYALNAVLEAPQCQKHRSKLPSVTSNMGTETPKPEASTVTRDSDKCSPEKGGDNVKPASRNGGVASSASIKHLMSSVTKASSSQKEQIARLLTSFVLSMGREDMSDKELRDFVWKIVIPSMPPKAVSTSGSASANDSPSLAPDAGSSTLPGGDMDPWRMPDQNISKIYSVASARGSAVPSFPTMAPPVSHTHEDMMRRNYMEEPRGRDQYQSHDRDSQVSSSESGRRSPFSRRDYSGNPTSALFHDQDVFNSYNSHGMYHGSTSVSKAPERTQNLHELRMDEITMDQLTKNRRNENTLGIQGAQQYSLDTIPNMPESRTKANYSIDNEEHSKFPPGILEMILRERKTRENGDGEMGAGSGEVLSENQRHRRRRRERYKKKKRKKKKRALDRSDESSSAESESCMHRSRRERRRKKRKKRDENRRRSPSSDSVMSLEDFAYQYTRRAPPREEDIYSTANLSVTPEVQIISNRSPLQENYPRAHLGYLMEEVRSPIVSPPLSVISQNRWDSESNSSIPRRTCPPISSKMDLEPKKNLRSPRDARLEEGRDIKKESKEDKEKRGPARFATAHASRSVNCTIKQLDDKKANVSSVSKTFWSSNNDENSLCSISTNGSLETLQKPEKTVETCPGKLQRQFRNSRDCENDEKEPGEISSDSDYS